MTVTPRQLHATQDRPPEHGVQDPAVSLDLLRTLASLASESSSLEVADSVIAARQGQEVADVRRVMERMAQEGLLYLKKSEASGYRGWISARGRSLL